MKAKSIHYVDNQKFLAEIVKYKKLCLEAEESGEDKPRISNYLGECILKIARKLANRPNFINYSYKDDMILDGIENCIQYFDNFDPEKSKNAFSYFTSIIWYAFLRRIDKEKKQSYIKGKIICDNSFEQYDIQEHDLYGDDFQNTHITFMQQNGSFDVSYEERRKAKRKKKQASLEELFNEDNE